jgi:hypothetical protein
MSAWTGGWYDAAPPAERNVILYLFSEHAEKQLPDVHALRRYSVATWRYQFTRNLSPAFAGLVRRLTETGAEAAELWARHEVVIPPHESPTRVRHPDHGIVLAHVAFTPLHPQLWLYSMILPKGISPPAS